MAVCWGCRPSWLIMIWTSVHSYGNKDSKSMSTATAATPFLPRDPCRFPVREPGSPTVAGAPAAAQEFALLEAWLASPGALQLPLHQIESQQQTKGREVQRLLLQAHLHRRGDGDVGPALRVSQDTGTVLYTHRRLRTRSLKTIFGPVEITRMGYSHPGTPSIYPLDRELALPARCFSYKLRKGPRITRSDWGPVP